MEKVLLSLGEVQSKIRTNIFLLKCQKILIILPKLCFSSNLQVLECIEPKTGKSSFRSFVQHFLLERNDALL
jgi:hypothetical protein